MVTSSKFVGQFLKLDISSAAAFFLKIETNTSRKHQSDHKNFIWMSTFHQALLLLSSISKIHFVRSVLSGISEQVSAGIE